MTPERSDTLGLRLGVLSPSPPLTSPSPVPWQVEDEYRVHWVIDNLPAATRYMTGFSTDGNAPIYAYERGYSMGFVGGAHPVVFNRLAKAGVLSISNPVTLTLIG